MLRINVHEIWLSTVKDAFDSLFDSWQWLEKIPDIIRPWYKSKQKHLQITSKLIQQLNTLDPLMYF